MRKDTAKQLLADLAEYWKEGDSPLYPGALLGDSDVPLRERVLALVRREQPLDK